MLGNFIYSNPTKIYFGDEAQKNLVDALSGFGKKVLLTYGGGSIKRNGVYNDVIAALNVAGKEVVELPGVMSNPTVKSKDILLLPKHMNLGKTYDYVSSILYLYPVI